MKKNKIIYIRTLKECPKCHETEGNIVLEARFRVLKSGTLKFEDFSVRHRVYNPKKYRNLVKKGISPQVAAKRYKHKKRCHLGKLIKNFGGF